ncbi:MAG: hypothetical protein N3F04_03415 [Candidatus Nezhaarchaeota archaeon]|nr:hypothetical protein [Candidatus Nezhaarchaeota archaeon]MCX8141812.1 hypothetical protein [Candidatus Nezhaarchaeota archaeon]MDW8050407.1 hypothetical protein [Nitrososphaerota archaeon]
MNRVRTLVLEKKVKDEKVLTIIPMLTPEHLALSKLYFLVITNKKMIGLYGGGVLSRPDKIMTLLEALGHPSIYRVIENTRDATMLIDKSIRGEEVEVNVKELENMALSRRTNFMYSIDEVEEVRVIPRKRGAFHKLVIKIKGKERKFLVSIKAISNVKEILSKALKNKVKLVLSQG